jgi:hypothetical protein
VWVQTLASWVGLLCGLMTMVLVTTPYKSAERFR